MIGKLNNLVMNLRILDNSILQKRFQPFLLASTEMILSHKHRFIFLKTRKTAGTSIEIALSKFCDNNDIITRITEQDEVLRSKLGFRGPQNFLVGPSKYALMDILKIIRNGKKFANLVKNSTTHIIIGSGHMIMIEKAFEMRKKIFEFLKS